MERNGGKMELCLMVNSMKRDTNALILVKGEGNGQQLLSHTTKKDHSKMRTFLN